jgi:hypothetical protein
VVEIEVPVALAAFGVPPRRATAMVVEQSAGERVFRTLSGVGSFWALALAGLFIPVAHFVLVPSFLTAGVVVGIRRAREDRRLLGVRGACPRCGVAQEFRVGGRFTEGRAFTCPSCHNYLSVSPGTALDRTA